MVPHPPPPPLAHLPFREDLNRLRAGNHRWDDLSYSRIRRARDKRDIWNSEYWAAEMRGATPDILTFNIPSIPIRSRKSKRLSEVSNRSDAEVTAHPSTIVIIQDSKDNTEGAYLPSQEENLAVRDGFKKIPSATDATDTQRADDALARGLVPGESNEPKGPGDASLSKGKGKVDPVDKKAEKKRIAAKAWRIPAFRIGGTCKVLPSDASVAQSLGVTPLAPLPVNSDSLATPLCSAVQTAVKVPHPPPRAPSLTPSTRLASELLPESSLSTRRFTCQWTFSHGDHVLSFCNTASHHKAPLISFISGVGVNLPSPDRLDRLSVISIANRIVSVYEVKTSALKEEKHKLEGEMKKRDAHLEAASTEMAKLRAILEKSRHTDEIASGTSAQSARHSSHLERICLYLVTLHTQKVVKAQLCYRRGARMSLEKMVEAEHELALGLLENYAKEEEEYLAQVESFSADFLRDDTLFPTPPPPPAGLSRDVASHVPEGINEHESFLLSQDRQDGDQV
ncbi:hypothetical protein AALP_AA7G149500 [Arabis alpina]|uniref:Uncharacterized protein n=1 Tax=Arabis alpina TaxID=50452 RepID=A0A087GI56_ARAAL|nr:hypothetical protein AALP_AA7G149500 [Arabis alpina]